MTTTKANRVSLTARVKPALKKALETESREHGQTTSNYVESILLSRGEATSNNEVESTELQEELEALQKENSVLKEKLETYVPENDLIQEQENAVYREEKFQARINELTAHIGQLSANPENTISSEEYDRIVSDKVNLESDKQVLQAKVHKLTEQLERMTQYNRENEDLNTRFLQLQETEKFLRINNEDLQAKVQKLTEEVEITEIALEEIANMNKKVENTYEARIAEISDELNEFKEIGIDIHEVKLVEEENDELHDRVESLEMQLIEQQEAHEIALQALEEEEPIDPAYVESLESSVADYKAKVAELENSLSMAEDEVYLGFTPEQHDSFITYLSKLHNIYDGYADEEMIVAALYCGVKNESAFFRKLVGDYLKN